MKNYWKSFTDKKDYWISTSKIPVFNPENFDVESYMFETMVFPYVDEPKFGNDVEHVRTSDEDEAYLNHLKMFEKYNNL